MSRFSTAALLLATFLIIGSYQNCGMQPSAQLPAGTVTSSTAVTVNATVQKSTLDGCNYLLCSNDNANGGKQTCFIPIAMDQSLLADGNVVTVSGVVRYDMVSTCMGGTILQVNSATLK